VKRGENWGTKGVSGLFVSHQWWKLCGGGPKGLTLSKGLAKIMGRSRLGDLHQKILEKYCGERIFSESRETQEEEKEINRKIRINTVQVYVNRAPPKEGNKR